MIIYKYRQEDGIECKTIIITKNDSDDNYALALYDHDGNFIARLEMPEVTTIME